LSLALVAVALLLVLSLALSFRDARAAGQGRTFWVANRRASALRVGGSLLATIVGASATLGTTDLVARHGVTGAWFLATALPFLVGLAVLAPTIRRSQVRSITDLLGRFGEGPRRLAGAVVALAWLGVLATQVVALRTLGEVVAPGQGATIAGAATAVVVGYTVLGGQPTVLRTDLAQLLVLGLGLALPAGWLLWRGGVAASSSAPLPPAGPLAPLDLGLLSLTAGLPYLVGPDLYSRLLAASDGTAARRAVVFALLGLPLIVAVLAVLGLAARSAGLATGEGAVLLRLASLLPKPLEVLLLVGVVAAVVSSASTILLSGAAALAGALEPALRRREPGVTGPARRGLVALYGAAGALAGLLAPDLLSVLLTGYALFVGALTGPILASLANARPTPAAVLAALASGGTLGVLGRVLRRLGVVDAGGEALCLGAALLGSALLLALGSLHFGKSIRKKAPGTCGPP
jgi:SSS family solute:Na+ symporter